MWRIGIIAVAAIAAVASLLGQAQQGAPTAKGKARAGKAPQAEAKAPTPPPVPQVLRLVRSNTYLVTGHGANSVFRVTPQGVILVDTKLPDSGDFERLTELIRGVTPQPVKYAFNTSAQPGSSGNNARFQAAGAELVTNERSVTLGGVEARAIRAGDRTLVYFPGEKLICLGDAAAASDPVALDAALKLDWTLAVPASGEPKYRAEIEKLRK